QRPPRAVVQQFVDRERRDQLGVQRGPQVGGGQADRVAGVRKALQGVHQNRAAPVGRRQLGRRELQLVHAGLSRLVVPVVGVSLVGHRGFLLSGVCPGCPKQLSPESTGHRL